nr:protein ALP1-like [Ipomoea batatas]
MFSNLDLFTILNDYRKSESLSKRLNIPIPETEPSSSLLVPSADIEESILSLPPIESENTIPCEYIPCLPAEPQDTGSEESQKIQVFPGSFPTARRRTRATSVEIEASSPTQTKRTKRKQSAHESVQAEKSPPKSKAQKRRKKTAKDQSSPSIDLTIDLTETRPAEDCVGAIDGTHIPAMVTGRDVSSYRNRHGIISQNVIGCL